MSTLKRLVTQARVLRGIFFTGTTQKPKSVSMPPVRALSCRMIGAAVDVQE